MTVDRVARALAGSGTELVDGSISGPPPWQPGTRVYLSGDGGGSWRLTQASPAGAAAGSPGFSYVGMTSPADGVALPADPGLHEVFITSDGGSTWRPRLISSS